jgi:hypothetical protein
MQLCWHVGLGGIGTGFEINVQKPHSILVNFCEGRGRISLTFK